MRYEKSAVAESQHPTLSTQHSALSTFDKTVLLVIAVLLAGIGLTVLLGDHVGVTLVQAGPLEVARSTSPIVIQFSEDMKRDTVTERLRIEPAVEGEFSWSGRTMIFRPAQALEPGQDYTVVLEPNAESETGRKVLAEYRFSFRVRTPLVAYLAPADSAPQNIWMVDPAQPASARQVTFSPSGVFDYGISPDGTRIAFSERNTGTGTSDLKLLDLETGALQQLTNCVDSDCTTPVWRPDGRMIAYQRVDYNSDLTNVGVSPTRVWLVDLTTTPASTRPLFADSQVLGHTPQWSADGSRIMVFDVASQGIVVYDFTTDDIALIPSRYGSTGALSPDGTRLVFPELIFDGSQARSHLQIADLTTREFSALTPTEEPIDDDMAAWHPDGQRIAIARRYLDDRWTRGRQIYLLNVENGSVEPLVVDGQYANGWFSWDPNGRQLVIQRFPELDASGQPNSAGQAEIWTYDLASGELKRVAVNGFFPRWLP
jgi:Tol biopolymer transport system component